MARKVLGLDLGVGSIGWCLITLDKDEKPQSILGMGSRIVPLSTDDATEFTQGKAITKNKMRTVARTIRKGMDRYQLRREALKKVLSEHGMLPDESLIKLPLLELWELRARAATSGGQLSLTELGRVLLHINQKRGYKHAKADEAAEAEAEGKSKSKKEKEGYVAQVKGRYQALKEKGQTIGQHFAEELRANRQTASRGVYYTYRIKEQVYPREAYIKEYDRIMAEQRVFYPQLLTDELIQRIRDRIIFYQRPLKSCKQLVSTCEFEKKERVVQVKRINKDGVEELVERTITIGPKVAPKSSPIFQVCKVWESIQNIRLYYPDGTERKLEQEEKQKLFDYLQKNDKLSLTALRKVLKIKPKDKLWCDKLLDKGIAGNTTTAILRKALKGYEQYEGLLRFDLKNKVDEDGVIRPIVDESYQSEPLYKLWHILYSIEDKDDMRSALVRQLGIKEEDLDDGLMDALYKIDFVKQGYGNKSAKFICKLLPHLQEGKMYSKAAEAAGVRHSDSMTAQERDERSLLETIPLLEKNALRQPVVEKILNQMINLVNALKREYGEIDEVRVELARELKMSREEREQVLSNNRKRKGKNETIAKRIAEYGLTPTKSRIQKYRLWQESDECCIYCGKHVDVVQFLRGEEIEVEHIIPRSILFDDSMSNKVCACRSCNQEKGNRFAMEYIQSKGWEQSYIERVNSLFHDKKISYSKRQRLLMLPENLPEDFIERHLRLSQYISREAQGILRKGIRLVSASEGSVTAKLRQLWGYDNILRDLNLERYRSMGETEEVKVEHRDGARTDERIKDWSKRKDHRHHAIDALVVACTQQRYIQRLNSVNAEADRQEMDAFIKEQQQEHKLSKKEKLSLLEHWLIRQPHFTTGEVTKHVEGILVSLRPGKRTISRGRNIYKRSGKTEVQRGVLIPRGALSEETIYGVIQLHRKDKSSTELERSYVKRIPLSKVNPSNVKNIVDSRIRDVVQAALLSLSGRKGVLPTELYLDDSRKRVVRSVRCLVRSSTLIPIRFNADGEAIGFTKPGLNHHVALYRDGVGNIRESVVPFFRAVERARYGIPMIISDPSKAREQARANPNLPESVLLSLPEEDWQLEEILQGDEMFLLGMTDEAIDRAMETKDYTTLGRHLYRVQSLAAGDYMFRYHLETTLDGKDNVGSIPKSYRIQGLKTYRKLNPRKVKIDLLGRISLA
nr:type II CRISPR RNA-guided endonuclease Cas9 [uncultured Porphyromonas sp.]